MLRWIDRAVPIRHLLHAAFRLAGLVANALGASALLIAGALLAAPFAGAQSPTAKIAVVMSLTGPGEFGGRPLLDAVRLAVDEANTAGAQPRIVIVEYDDRSDADGAREAARRAGASDALVVLGPASSELSLVACPLYAEAGLAAILGTAHEDTLTANATTFRSVFSTSEMGDALGNYLSHVLAIKRAVVLLRNNSYGQQIAAGFRGAAERLGVATTYRGFGSAPELEDAARAAAADPERPAIVLAMTYDDAAPTLIALRHNGVQGPILGGDTMARASFADLFQDQPEYRRDQGFFTDGVYALAPAILDSANAETLAFADRYRSRYGREPSWEAVQSYDSARLAVAAIGAVLAAATVAAPDLKSRREAIRAHLASLDGLAHAVAGLTGPLWFSPDRGRRQAARVGRYHGALFESAPRQLVPVYNPDPAEVAANALVDLGSERFARLQEVVYTGVFLNDIPRVDIAQSTFTADFYLWMRFARGAGAAGADPAQIYFPDLIRGSSEGKQLAAQRDRDDGTTYRLWRMRGDFKNDFDLHRYPADRQTLAVRFFNARAASDRLVYVLDRRSFDDGVGELAVKVSATAPGLAAAHAGPAAPANASTFGSAVAPAAFRNLTQWEPLRSSQRRDSLVTESALGDPELVGFERVRELSGFVLTVDLQRRMVATLAKTLLPLGLMALIMYASLHFPPALVKEKITVAITGALSGAVLLSSINSQLGNVGYVLAVEYGFHVFFTLCLLCILAALFAERFRVAGRQPMAATVERSGRYLFLLAVAGTIAAATVAYGR
jgi:branched-chain amino acid transport system substrate-binding protein